MTIEFPKTTETCNHTAPTFGCKSCIDKDREGAIRQFYVDTPKPICPRLHHGPMTFADGNRGTMTITYWCTDCAAVETVPVR